MKTIVFGFLLLIPFYLCAQKQIVGNGKSASETRQLSTDFTGIVTFGSIDVVVDEGKSDGKIKVEAESNILEYVETVIKNKQLYIKLKDNQSYSLKKPIRVNFQSTQLNSIESKGSGNVSVNSKQTVKSFSLITLGSGNIQLKVSAQDVNIKKTGSGKIKVQMETQSAKLESSGSGSIQLSGNATVLSATLKGSAELMANELNAKIINLYKSGSGNAIVNCEDELNVESLGSGNVYYLNKPIKLNAQTKGSGKIRSK